MKLKKIKPKLLLFIPVLFVALGIKAQSSTACDCLGQKKLASDSALTHFHPSPSGGTRIKVGLNDQCNPNGSVGCKGWCGFRFILHGDTVFVAVDCAKDSVIKVKEASAGGDNPSSAKNDLSFEVADFSSYFETQDLIVKENVQKKFKGKFSISENYLYPNPILEGENINIFLKSDLNTTLVDLVDIYGTSIKQVIINDWEKTTATFQTTGMSTGIYFVIGRVNGETVFSEKVIIIK